jgi:hypothetical protein
MWRKYTDPQGNTVQIYENVPRANGTIPFNVEVVKNGEVIDHYTLYGEDAVQYCARAKNWKRATTP